MRWRILIAVCLASFASLAARPVETSEVDWRPVPAGTYMLGSREDGAAFGPKRFRLNEFSIAATETTVAQFCVFLNATAAADVGAHPQIELEDDRYVPQAGKGDEPVAFAAYSDAQSFCRWLSQVHGTEIRLPTRHEWEAAARGGVRGGRYPWGWGAPQGRANFAGAAIRPVGEYPPNNFGICDMAGNLFEWCRGEASAEAAAIRGGSWAEKDPRLLRVFHEVRIDPGYRGADVGFRVVKPNGDSEKERRNRE